MPCGLPVGSLFSGGEGGDGNHGECQQAAPSECATTSRCLLLHGQNNSQPGKQNNKQRGVREIIHINIYVFVSFPLILFNFYISLLLSLSLDHWKVTCYPSNHMIIAVLGAASWHVFSKNTRCYLLSNAIFAIRVSCSSVVLYCQICFMDSPAPPLTQGWIDNKCNFG